MSYSDLQIYTYTNWLSKLCGLNWQLLIPDKFTFVFYLNLMTQKEGTPTSPKQWEFPGPEHVYNISNNKGMAEWQS